MVKVVGNLKEIITDGVAEHMTLFPSLYRSTVPGPQGQRGPKGEQGISVHHIKGTSTTDLEGDFGSYGETDTYTLYGDADETINLGHFSVRNGIEGKDSYEYAVAGGYTGTEGEFYEEIRQVKTYRDQAQMSAVDSFQYSNASETYRNQAQVAAVASANSAIASANSAGQSAASAAEITELFTPTNIKNYYESNSNTNVFTDAEKAKLGALEVGATADLTGPEIKALYEAQTGKVLDSTTRLDLGDGSGPGRMTWNVDEKTVDLRMSANTTLQVGQEMVQLVRNGTASTINNGKVVMVTGTAGASGRLVVGLHTGTKADGKKVIGMATEDIVAGGDGFVTCRGKVRGLNTTGSTVGENWLEGDVLYIKPGNQGDLTKVVPADTELKMPVARVIYRHANIGTLMVMVNGVDENLRAMADSVRVVPQGNLSSITVQSALTELQADLDKLLVDKEW